MEKKKFDYANKMIHMEKQLHCGRKQFETRNFLKVCFMVCFILVLSFGRNSQAQHTVRPLTYVNIYHIMIMICVGKLMKKERSQWTKSSKSGLN